VPLEALVPTGSDCRAHMARPSTFAQERGLEAGGSEGAGRPEKLAKAAAAPLRAATGRYERSATAASGETMRKLKDSSRYRWTISAS